MDAVALVLQQPATLALETLALAEPTPADVVVEIDWSGISHRHRKAALVRPHAALPGHGLPAGARLRIGRRGRRGRGRVRAAASATRVFVPGANCFGDGARPVRRRRRAAGRAGQRASAASTRRRGDRGRAAGAGRHRPSRASPAPRPRRRPDRRPRRARPPARAPDRRRSAAPRRPCWEVDPAPPAGAERLSRRRTPTRTAPRLPRHLRCLAATPRCSTRWSRAWRRGGEIVLAGFYAEPRRLRLPARLHARGADPRRRRMDARGPASPSRALVDDGRCSLDGLITHRAPAARRRRRLPHRLRRPGLPEDDPRLESTA